MLNSYKVSTWYFNWGTEEYELLQERPVWDIPTNRTCPCCAEKAANRARSLVKGPRALKVQVKGCGLKSP